MSCCCKLPVLCLWQHYLMVCMRTTSSLWRQNFRRGNCLIYHTDVTNIFKQSMLKLHDPLYWKERIGDCWKGREAYFLPSTVGMAPKLHSVPPCWASLDPDIIGQSSFLSPSPVVKRSLQITAIKPQFGTFGVSKCFHTFEIYIQGLAKT